MKISSNIIKILAGVLCAFVIIYFTLNGGNKIDIFIPENTTVNEPIVINITISKNLENYSPDKVDIKFYNKYNKNESIESELKSYDTGKYSIIVTPNYEGEYIFDISTQSGNDQFSESRTFTVGPPTEEKK